MPDQVSIWCSPRTDPITGQPHQLSFDQLFLDPWTGEELGRRRTGDISQGRINLMAFIYKLHKSLALGRKGSLALGIVALLWTVDCFVGFYLTLPAGNRAFWRRWKLAWLIKWRASAFRLNFDLHRAGGLWLWPLFFIFAWSGVMLNLRPVYDRVTRAVFDYKPDSGVSMSLRPRRTESPRLDWRAAQATGERLTAEQAAIHGFAVKRPVGLGYVSELGLYRYSVRSSRDVRDRGWDTDVTFDGDTGELRILSLPTGQHRGNTVTNWLWALHFADVFGLVIYRLVVCAWVNDCHDVCHRRLSLVEETQGAKALRGAAKPAAEVKDKKAMP